MKKLIRCKACGYIMEEGKLGDKCPACGAPKASFLPYTDPVGPARRRWLGFDLHPIAVHFPTTFAVGLCVFSVAAAIFSGVTQSMLISTVKVMALLLPAEVILAGILGYLDGRVRFRKISNSHILKRKILFASLLLVVSLVLAFLVWMPGLEGGGVWLTLSSLMAIIAIILSIVLANYGISIKDAAFPGN